MLLPDDRQRADTAETSAVSLPAGDRWAGVIDGPVFILAPPRSYTSLVCTMLGQHPQMYGLPELHLFMANTIQRWRTVCARASFTRGDGTIRAIAELFYGGQTEETVEQAYAWLERRSYLSTGVLFELLARQVSPRIVIEKSPSITYAVARMRRAHSMFPGARYIHLLRHPRTQGESMVKQIERKRARGVRIPRYWLDPPEGWYANHQNIIAFLELLPPERSIRVRAEELLEYPDEVIERILRWLGLRTDPEAIDAVKHPERSPYAKLGPRGARFGGDHNFLESPEFRPGAPRPVTLRGPVSWRTDGAGLPLHVKQLAREFGYA